MTKKGQEVWKLSPQGGRWREPWQTEEARPPSEPVRAQTLCSALRQPQTRPWHRSTKTGGRALSHPIVPPAETDRCLNRPGLTGDTLGLGCHSLPAGALRKPGRPLLPAPVPRRACRSPPTGWQRLRQRTGSAHLPPLGSAVPSPGGGCRERAGGAESGRARAGGLLSPSCSCPGISFGKRSKTK